jgi:magnesium transporter
VETSTVPHVKSFYVFRPFGDPSLLIPMENVVSISKKEIIVDIDSIEYYQGSPKEDEMLLRDYVMDKKVIDIEEHEVSVVNDIRIAVIDKKAYVWDVDFSVYGFYRRMGLKWLADMLKIKDNFISWSYIQALPPHISSFKGDIKLKTLKEKLSEIPPVDMADILEELNREQRTELFNELEPEHASDTLEELQPSVQREIISTLNKETVILLINEMTPAQAADLLSVISYSIRKEILEKVDPEMKEKIQSLVEQQDEKILNFTTLSFLKYFPDDTVETIKDNYYNEAKDKKIVMYIYVVDEIGTLKGVFDIKELLQAEDNQYLKDIMTENIIDLKPDSTLKEAASMFTRYGFRAIPVTDENNILLGVIPYKDVINLKHRFF